MRIIPYIKINSNKIKVRWCMESKRYKLVYNKDELGYMIIDTENTMCDEIHDWNLLCDLLNEQDLMIKTLKSKYEDRKYFFISTINSLYTLISNLLEEK